MSRFGGVIQWFGFGDEQTLDRSLQLMNDLSIKEIRTAFSWADWEREGGPAWLDHVVARLHGAGIRLFPTLFYTPLPLARIKPGDKPRTGNPPRDLSLYTSFAETMIDRYGHAFEWMHLWNEPNWRVYWNDEIDPTGELFATMTKPAIRAAHKHGKKVLIGGLTPVDLNWISHMLEFGLLQKTDALGLHASPGSWYDRRGIWVGWPKEIALVRQALRGRANPEIWITEGGVSTWGQGIEREIRMQFQIEYFESLPALPVERVWWYSLLDQAPDAPTDDAINIDVSPDAVAYHFGLETWEGKRKPLYYHWRKYGLPDYT